MDTNNFFSFQRIAMVMKRELMENWKKNLYAFIGIYAAFLIVMVVQMGNASGTPGDELRYKIYCNGYVEVFTLGALFLSFINASSIMEGMQTKEQRISFLMLPATMIEKFVARFLYVTVGLIVAILVAVSLAELTRLMLMPLFDLPEMYRKTVLPDVFWMMFVEDDRWIYIEGEQYPWLANLFVWCWLLWSHSLYILGGNYWYKKPFFKTLGTIILVMLVGSFAMIHIVDWVGGDTWMNIGNWLEEHTGWMTLAHVYSFGVAFFSAFTLFNWWLSYKLFTRAQVVKPKFRLL